MLRYCCCLFTSVIVARVRLLVEWRGEWAEWTREDGGDGVGAGRVGSAGRERAAGFDRSGQVERGAVLRGCQLLNATSCVMSGWLGG